MKNNWLVPVAALVVLGIGILGFLYLNLGAEAETSEQVVFAWADYGPDIMEYPLDNRYVDYGDLDFSYKKIEDELLAQALLSGDVDIGTLGASAFPLLHSQGVTDLVIIGGWYKEPVIDGMSVAQLFASRDSGIERVEDLSGKIVAIDSPVTFNSLMLSEVLKQHDMSYDDMDVVYNDMSQVLLEEGEADAAMVWSSFIWESGDDFVSVLDFGKEFAEEYGTTPPLTLIVTKRSFYDTHRSEVDEVLRILNDAYSWSRQNMEAIAFEYEEEYEMDSTVFINENMQTRMMYALDGTEVAALQKVYDIGHSAGHFQEEFDVGVYLP